MDDEVLANDKYGSDWTQSEVRDFVTRCYDRDTNLAVLLGYSAGWLSNRVIAIVGKSSIQPYMAAGWDPPIGRDQLKSVRADFIAKFEQAEISGPKPFALVYEALELESPERIGVIPIPIGNRTAMMVFGEVLGDDLGDLPDIAAVVGEQLEQLIVLTKGGTLPPVEDRVPELPERFRSSEQSEVDQSEIEPSEAVQSEIEQSDPEQSSEPELSDVEEVEQSAGEQSEAKQSEVDQLDDPQPHSEATSENHESALLTSSVASFAADDSIASVAETEDDLQSESAAEHHDAESSDVRATEIDPKTELVESALHGSSAASFAEEERHRPTMKMTPDPTSRRTIRLDADAGARVNDAIENDIRATQELDGFAPGQTFNGPGRPTADESTEIDAMPNTPSGTTFGMPATRPAVQTLAEQSGNAGSTTFGAPAITVPDVSIVPPNPIVDESRNTLMGGISADHDSLPSIDRPSSVAHTLPGGLEAVGVEPSETQTEDPEVRNPSPQQPSNMPGAAIFKGRRKAKSVGHFVPTKSRTDVEPVPKEESDASSSSEEVKQEAATPPAVDPKTKVRKVTPYDDEWEQYFIDSERPTEKIDFNANDRPTEKVESPATEVPTQKVQPLETAETPDEESVAEQEASAGEDELDPSVFDGIGPSGDSPLPDDVLEALLEAGPSVVELQESFLLLDSRNRATAFKAADEIAALGTRALDILDVMFPGRVFVDRYQYTPESLPAAEHHTPILSVMVRLGPGASHVPARYLDHKSTETRFYAILALAALNPQGYLNQVYERLFDKDAQIRECAKKIIIQNQDDRDFPIIRDQLRAEFEQGSEDFRIETTVDLIASLKDVPSVEPLIEMLGQYGTRTNQRIHTALQKLTLKTWSSPYEWKHWWNNAKHEPRHVWLIDALDAAQETTRKMAFEEVQRLPGLQLNYHPDQPSKLRRRAQRELRAWFESRNNA